MIGEAAHYMGLEAILAPSAATSGSALSIFLNKLLPDSMVDVVQEELLEQMPHP